MKITVIGLGCVAMADALALARTHEVVMTGPMPDRVDDINRGVYGLEDPGLASYLASHALNLRAMVDTRAAIANADMVFIATPLSTDPGTGEVSLIELDSRIEFIARNYPHFPIILRSAVPVGYCDSKLSALDSAKLVYVPEFSRDGHMLTDVLHPRFLIAGDRHALGEQALNVLKAAALRNDIPTRQMGPTEAEMARHLSTLFHATRVTYFNELDSYAMHLGLNARQIIDGVSMDPRIGSHANNPCFGYDRRALPLVKQMMAGHLDQLRTPLLSNLDRASIARVAFLADQIVREAPAEVGFYMPDSATPLSPSLRQLKSTLEASGIRTRFHNSSTESLEVFKSHCELVVSRRDCPDLSDITAKVFTRDHFSQADTGSC